MLGLEFENPQEFSCSVDDAKLSHGQSPAPEITLEHTGTVTPGHRYKGRYEAAMTINGCEADPSANWQSYPVRWTGSTGYISIPPVINSIQLFSFSDFEFHNRLVVGQSIQIMPQINAVKQTNTITLIVEGPGIPKRRIVFYGDGSSVADGISDIIPTEAGTLTLWVEVSGVRDDDEEETEDWTILSAPFYIPIATEACPAEGSTMDPNANCSGQTPGSDAGAGGETTDEEKDESSGCSAAGTGLSLLGVIPFALLGWKRRKHHSDFQND
ncbi:MAG: hypothetical protein LBM75_11290 [Myxococcales bacterium]|nr:hypothetical protein [Myxococcales bacterium]